MVYESLLGFQPIHKDLKKSKFSNILQTNFETAKPNGLKSCKLFKVVTSMLIIIYPYIPNKTNEDIILKFYHIINTI